MYQLCRHILAAGRRCTQPAVGGKVYCRHHQVIQRTKEASVLPPDVRGLNRALAFLYPEDRASITANAFLVLRALDDGRIDTHTANTMNSLLRTCQSNLNRGPLHQSGEAANPAPRHRHDDWFDDDQSTPDNDTVVRHVVLTPEGQELAPIAEVLEEDEKQNHGEQCPCRQCARQYRHEPAETHNAQCECAECANNRTQSEALRAQQNANTAANAVANTNTAFDPGLNLPNGAQETMHNSSSANLSPELVPDPWSLVPAFAPEPWMRPIPPREPLVLTPEEEERFKRLESRYIHDPKLADHVRETYRQLREERLARRTEAAVLSQVPNDLP